MMAQAEGWRLRVNIIWTKGQNERADIAHIKRPKISTERIIVLSKVGKYFWNVENHLALPESERGDLWTISPRRDKNAERHFAPYPLDLATRMVALSSAPGDLIVDPFHGSGTTGAAAVHGERNYVGIELYGPQAAAA